MLPQPDPRRHPTNKLGTAPNKSSPAGVTTGDTTWATRRRIAGNRSHHVLNRMCGEWTDLLSCTSDDSHQKARTTPNMSSPACVPKVGHNLNYPSQDSKEPLVSSPHPHVCRTETPPKLHATRMRKPRWSCSHPRVCELRHNPGLSSQGAFTGHE